MSEDESRTRPAVVDRPTFDEQLEVLRAREKAHTREGDAIAAARRRLPMVEVAADSPLHRAARPGHSARRLRRTASAHCLLLHVVADPTRGRAVRRLHVGDESRGRAGLPALPRHHLRGAVPGAEHRVRPWRCADVVRREPPLPRLHGLGHAVVLRPALAGHAPRRPGARSVPPGVLSCGMATGSSRRTGPSVVGPRRWTTATRSWTSPCSGRQEAWEDSPAGWPRLGHTTRTLGGAPEWPPLWEWPGGRPTAQWPRLDAGYSDDLGATVAGAGAPPDHCH